MYKPLRYKTERDYAVKEVKVKFSGSPGLCLQRTLETMSCASGLPLGLERAEVEGPFGSEWQLVGGFSDKEVIG